jgi:predicted DNA-binding transcriptional regulator YafY
MPKNPKPSGISEKVVRLLEIYTIIARKTFPSLSSLMERFHVSERTVYRYLELINFIDPIEYDTEKEGYSFVHGDRIKKLIITDEELMTLFTAGEAVAHLGTPFRENFKNLMERMFLFTVKTPANKKPPILIKAPDALHSEKLDGILQTVSTCIHEKRSIDITYNAHLAREVTERTVDPYGLVFYEGVWILMGFCHLRKKIRSFALDRIQTIKERYLYFTPPKDFDLEAYLSHSWGIIDDTEVDVTVRFHKDVADYILRKDKWHPSEKRNILPDGDIMLSFTVAGVNEIKRWIYSWLPNVVVVEPQWLRKQVQEELAGSLKDHSL